MNWQLKIKKLKSFSFKHEKQRILPNTEIVPFWSKLVLIFSLYVYIYTLIHTIFMTKLLQTPTKTKTTTKWIQISQQISSSHSYCIELAAASCSILLQDLSWSIHCQKTQNWSLRECCCSCWYFCSFDCFSHDEQTLLSLYLLEHEHHDHDHDPWKTMSEFLQQLHSFFLLSSSKIASLQQKQSVDSSE